MSKTKPDTITEDGVTYIVDKIELTPELRERAKKLREKRERKKREREAKKEAS